MANYIYEYESWSVFIWEEKKVEGLLIEVCLLKGVIFGQMESFKPYF